MALERSGFRVWAASDGREAVRLFRLHRDRIAVVLLDVEMPNMDGPQTLDRLRELDPTVVACFMSGGFGEYTCEELARRGAAQIFAKPFRLHELTSALHQMVQLSSSVADRCLCQE
jgi:CheY-like chemotaxis protein